MNDTMGEPAGGETGPEPAAQTQISAAFDALFSQDNRWSVGSSVGSVTMTRGWPDGSADTLIIVNPTTAFGMRHDPRGDKAWSVNGTLQEVVAAARDLDAPLAPDAPTDSVPEYKCDWRE